MEWQQLIGFNQVARLQSFTKAAEATLRTQSALSQQVKALETELGCTLFDRMGKGKLRVTPAGELLLAFAESVLEKHEAFKGELDALKGIDKGSLRIAGPFTTLYHLFPEKLKVYLQRFPEVEVTLLDRPQATVIDLAKSGEVDFGFALESVVPKGMGSIRWEKVRTVLMVPCGHPLGKLRRVSLKQLAAYPLILPPRSVRNAGRTFLEEELRRHGVALNVVMESSNVELSSVYVELGLGVSFGTIADGLSSIRSRKLELIAMDHYFKPDYVAVVMRKNKVASRYEEAFLSVLLESPVSE